jgi:murein DD-endopeptidase MepM/ murein hydrolase activator NlpD
MIRFSDFSKSRYSCGSIAFIATFCCTTVSFAKAEAAMNVPPPAIVTIGSAAPARPANVSAAPMSTEPRREYPVAYVTVSRAPDLSGQKPVYFSKSAISGSGSVISMSTTRPPPMMSSYNGALPSGMPLAGAALTSGFGMREHPLLGGLRAHYGVDLAAPAGAPIMATQDGVVSLANWAGGYGLAVALDHGGGLETRYGHMSRLNVVPGQRVHQGDVIGYVGSTGLSTGPHLHYEVRINGQPVNPLRAKSN